jgi:uncharacterized protein (TIGR00369 family)
VEFKTRIPFVEQLGFELLRFQGGEAEVAVEVNEALSNSWGVAHGGVLMTLLDVAMAQAARSPDQPEDPPRPGVVTVEMKTSFMRPGLGRLMARGRLLHRTASLAFCDGTVHDADGRIVGHASGTFKYMKALPVGNAGRRIHKLNASD